MKTNELLKYFGIILYFLSLLNYVKIQFFMYRKMKFLCGLFFLMAFTVNAQHSVARDWNEELLEAIRNDFARPTVHARNLFHSSILMYDSWAVFDGTAETVFLGKTFG